MADSEVRTRLVVDLAGSASKEMGLLAKEAYEVVDATKEVNRELRQTPRVDPFAGTARARDAQPGPGRGTTAMSPAAQAAYQYHPSAVAQHVRIVAPLPLPVRLAGTSDMYSPGGGVGGDTGVSRRQPGSGSGNLPSWNNLGGFVYGAMGLGAVTHGVDSLAKMMNAMGNAALDVSMKSRAMIEAIPVFGYLGTAVIKLGDAASGATERIRKALVSIENTGILTGIETARRQRDVAAEREFIPREAGATGFAMAKGSQRIGDFVPRGLDRSTVQGELEYAARTRMLPHEQAGLTAEAELIAARRRAESMRLQAGRLGADERQAQTRFDAADFREKKMIARDAAVWNAAQKTAFPAGAYEMNRPGRTQRIETHTEQLNAITELLPRMQASYDALQARSREMASVAQREYDLRAQLVAKDKERLGVLQEQEQRLRGQAQNWGSLSQGERNAALAFARQGQQNFASLTPEMKSLITAGGGGLFVARGNEALAQKDAGFQEFSKIIGEKDSLGNVRQQIEGLQTKIEVDVKLNEEALAKQFREVLAPIFAELEEKSEAIAKVEAYKLRVERLMQGLLGQSR